MSASSAHLHSPLASPRTAPNGVVHFPVEAWSAHRWLTAAFSTRRGGSTSCYGTPHELNLQFTPEDDPECVRTNRRLLAEALTGSPNTPLVTLRQIHSNLIHRVTSADTALEPPLDGDGLITEVPDLLIGIMTADCIPVLISDTRRHIVAAFHAGWRGTVARIVEGGVARLRQEFGSQPSELVAAIGAGIGPCCYAVGKELEEQFTANFTYASELFHKDLSHGAGATQLHLDLVEANRRQLLAAGLAPEAIELLGGCTQCRSDLFFSYRAEHGITGRLMAVIGIKSSI